MIRIRRASLYKFWSRELGTIRGNFTMLGETGTTAREELGLEGWLPPLGPYLLKDEVGMGVECFTLRISFKK